MAVMDLKNKTVIGLRRVEQPNVSDALASGGIKVARAKYSFATEGGAVSDIALGVTIPSGAVILGGYLDVQTILASGGAATAAIKVEAANDIINAAAFDGAPWSTTGRKSIIPVFTGATTVKTTAARAVTLTVGAVALTAGIFEVVLYYSETA
jgi:hypothetical protein